MSIAKKIMKFATEEAIRTQSPKIYTGTMNDFMRKIGVEDKHSSKHSSKRFSKRFQRDMTRLLKDRMIFDYIGDDVKVRIVPKSRVLRALQSCIRSISSKLISSLRRS